MVIKALRNYVPYGQTDCTFTVFGRHALLSGVYPLKIVRDATSYYMDGYKFSPAFRARKWDGKKHFFNLTTGALPDGLIHLVVKALRAYDGSCKIEVVDKSEAFPTGKNLPFELNGIEFGKGSYDYQLEAAKAMVTGRRGVVKMATNSGKTAVACAVIRHLGLPALFLVERISLVYQTRKRFAEYLGIPIDTIGIIGDSNFSLGDITVATPDSLSSRLARADVQDYVKKWAVVICDEAHHVSSDLFYSVVDSIHAPYRWGMSGTPLDRSDGADMRLLAQTGPVLYEVSNKLLVDRGISVPPEVEIIKIKEPVLSDKGLTWNSVQTSAVTNNDALNNSVANKAVEHADKGAQILVLVEKIAHGKTILDKIRAQSKHYTVYLTGKESGASREEVFDRYREGKVRIMVATTILDEGVDIPNIDVLILAAGGKAKIRLLQRVGRGLRTREGKKRLLVIDFALFCHRWVIQHSLQRLKTYKAEDCFDIRVIGE